MYLATADLLLSMWDSERSESGEYSETAVSTVSISVFGEPLLSTYLLINEIIIIIPTLDLYTGRKPLRNG